ncbi:MAG: type I-E CRISPR-associated protein Cse2/CasB [Cyanobacteria bacterium MAG CAR2_bin_4]|nr:type I-E CRISPR-associated protein Cse2/CasB [Cyanobacteria bacterium MAG CAR2_bin_4]
MDASEFSRSFFDHLQKRSESDSSAVGTLRRSLMFDPGTDSRAFPLVEHWTNGKTPRDRGTIYLAAGLWAQVVRRQGQGKPMLFPDAMRRVRDKHKSDSIEKRFATLLDADPDELRWRLRSALTLVASQGTALAWPDLLDDMLKWHYSDRRVQTQWARHFWGEPEAST